MHEPIPIVQPPASKPSFQPGSNGNNRFSGLIPSSEPIAGLRMKNFKAGSIELKGKWEALMKREHDAEHELRKIEERLLELVQGEIHKDSYPRKRISKYNLIKRVQEAIQMHSDARQEARQLFKRLAKIKIWLHSTQRKRSFEEFHSLAQQLSAEESAIIESSRYLNGFNIDPSSSPSILRLSSESILKGINGAEPTSGSFLDFCSIEEYSPATVAKASGFLRKALKTNFFWDYFKFYELLKGAMKTLDKTTRLSCDLLLLDKRRRFF